MAIAPKSVQTLMVLGLSVLLAQACGSRQQGSTLAGAEGGSDAGYPETAQEDDDFELISDDAVEEELSSEDYSDVSDFARVKLFARGANGQCSDWIVKVRSSSDEENILSFVYIKPKVLEKRLDKDGVYGAAFEGDDDALLGKSNRGKIYGEMILRVRTHGARDGMVVLAKQGSKLSISARYRPCDGGSYVRFPETVLDVKNGRQRFGVDKNKALLARDAAIIVKTSIPKEKKTKPTKKGKGSGAKVTAE